MAHFCLGERIAGKNASSCKMAHWILRRFSTRMEGLSQILCKHRNAVQIEQNLFKAEVAQAAAALFSK